MPCKLVSFLATLSVLISSNAVAEIEKVAPTNESKSTSEETANAVSGTIQDTAVELTKATMESQLAIFEGKGWGSDPSLLIFLFHDSGTVPEGHEFVASANAKFQGMIPHVHYRWRDPTSGKLMTKIASSKYNMRLVFGKVADGELPGTIAFSVPGEPTRVAGKFRAKIKQ